MTRKATFRRLNPNYQFPAPVPSKSEGDLDEPEASIHFPVPVPVPGQYANGIHSASYFVIVHTNDLN